jgi:hypothetical protein
MGWDGMGWIWTGASRLDEVRRLDEGRSLGEVYLAESRVLLEGKGLDERKKSISRPLAECSSGISSQVGSLHNQRWLPEQTHLQTISAERDTARLTRPATRHAACAAWSCVINDLFSAV